MTTSPTLLMLLDELHTLALNDLPAVFTGEVFDSTLELPRH